MKRNNKYSPKIYLKPDGDEGGGGDAPETADLDPVHISTERKEFNKKFAPPAEAFAGSPPPAGAKPFQKPEEKPTVEGEPPKEGVPPKEHKPPGSNIKKIIEDKRGAEAKLAEAQKKLEEYEAKKLPELNSKIEELQKKVDGGRLDPVKEEAYEKRIKLLEKEKEDKITQLEGDLQSTKKRLQLYDTTEDPVYREKYLQPMVMAVEDLKQFSVGNQTIASALQRAVMAQKSAMEATSMKERTECEEQRDQIIQSVMDGMQDLKAKRFERCFNAFVDASEKQTMALAQIEKTNEEIRQEGTRRNVEVAQRTIKEWDDAFVAAGEDYAEDIVINDEVKGKLKEMQIEIDPDKAINFGRAAVHGKLNRDQTVQLLQRGGRYEVVVAKLKATEALLKERDEQLAELRGAAVPSSSASKGNNTPAKKEAPAVNTEGKTRAEWQQKFKPPGTPQASR